MMNFSDYMQSLHEDFDHANDNSKEFGQVTPSSKKENNDLGEDNNIQEADEFGVDKLDDVDSEGMDAAAKAANYFSNASDGDDTDVDMIFNKALTSEDFDSVEESDFDMSYDDRYFNEATEADTTIPDLPADVRKNLREAAEYILAVLNEEEYAPNGEDPDDHINDDGVDQNTVPAYPEENDQFSNVDGLSDDFVDNNIEESATDWDDLF